MLLDEFAEFSSQSEESLARILSLCRKYGLYLVLAHQTWSQTSERLKGALGNVGMEVAFRLSRQDAEYSATIFGRINPMLVKHIAEDEEALERTHPVFYTAQEQWNTWAEAIANLKPRDAFIRLPNGKVSHIQIISVPDPKVSEERLAEVEDYYLRTCFTPRQDVEAALARLYEGGGQDTTLKHEEEGHSVTPYPQIVSTPLLSRSEPLPEGDGFTPTD